MWKVLDADSGPHQPQDAEWHVTQYLRFRTLYLLCYSQHPEMWRLSGADSGPFHPEGAGQDVAREVP
jgi:hypothetical protein